VKSLPLIGTLIGILLAFFLNKLIFIYFKTTKYNSKDITYYNSQYGSVFLSFIVSLKTFLGYK
jgi:hypothetical protein